jgi:hypothetical protein
MIKITIKDNLNTRVNKFFFILLKLRF